MNDSWVSSRLGDLAEVTIGRTPPRKEPSFWTKDLTLPFCTIADMAGKFIDPSREGITAKAEIEGKAKRVPKGALLMSFKLTIGKVGFASRDLFPNEAIAWLRVVDARLSEGFLALAIESQDLSLEAGQAVKGKTLNKTTIGNIPIRFPPKSDQLAMVSLVNFLDIQSEQLALELAAATDLYDSLLARAMSGEESRSYPLRDGLRLDINRVPVESQRTYRIAGIANAGRGLIDRGSLAGEDTDYSHLNQLRSGQLVMRKLTAWEGPIAVVPALFDGFFASGEFPTFSLDPARILPEFLGHVCRWPGLWYEMRQRVTGSVQRRKRLSPDDLMSVVLPLPAIDIQRRYALLFDAAMACANCLKCELGELRSLRRDMLRVLARGDLDLSVRATDVGSIVG